MTAFGERWTSNEWFPASEISYVPQGKFRAENRSDTASRRKRSQPTDLVTRVRESLHINVVSSPVGAPD